jgi:uncharacterized protein YjbI with pentapeptide repeats
MVFGINSMKKHSDIQEKYEINSSKKSKEDSRSDYLSNNMSIYKYIGLFAAELEEKVESGDYDFQGYNFPEEVEFTNRRFEQDVNFNGATFEQDVNFNGATFEQDVNFNGATFEQDVNFNGATFEQDVNFNKATFKQNAVFSHAVFQKNVSFNGTLFLHHADFLRATFEEYASFEWSTFQKDATFNKAVFHNAHFDNSKFKDASFNKTIFKDVFFDNSKFRNIFIVKSRFNNVSFESTVIEQNLEFEAEEINELNLQKTQFLFKGCIMANLTKAKFHGAELKNAAFVDCYWPERIFEETDKDLSPRNKETIYRNLKQNMQHNGDYTWISKFFYREMEMKRKGAEKMKNRIWLEIYRLLAGYGERPLNPVAVSFLVVSLFAWFYKVFGCLQYAVVNPCLFQQVLDVFYFSFVTFTTLGLGDIHPVTSLGKVLVCCEAMIGAFLIALFVVVFVRKMAR